MPIAPTFRLTQGNIDLRPLTIEDVPALHSTVMGDAEVMHFINKPSTFDEVQNFVQAITSGYANSDFGWLAVVPSESSAVELPVFCGIACLKPFGSMLRDVFGDHIEVGYWLAKAAWGKGVATAAAKALVQYGFRDLNLAEIVGVADVKNVASNKVLQKAGLVYRKTAPFREQQVKFYSATREELQERATSDAVTKEAK
jgi:ribosomal-protein-alanine N-acetyltransferase